MKDYPETALSRWVDPMLVRLGSALSWIWLVLLAVIVINVLLRYAFSLGRIELEELQWHLYSVGFLAGLGFALKEDAHIRVDVLHANFSPRIRAWIELYGILLLLLPFIALIIVFSVPFVAQSFALAEISNAPGGLPYRWAIKAMLPIGFLILLAAVLARLSRVWAFLFGHESVAHEESSDGR